MTARIDQLDLLAREEIVSAPVLSAQAEALSEGCTDRNFGLPAPLLLGSFALFMAYLAVMSIGFMADGLVLPMAVNVIFVAAFAYVPAKWATMKPRHDDRALSWAEFKARGIDTLTGRTGAGEAATLVLLLPACIFFWGVATVTIAALV
ncbi:hypothetical protein OMW55_08175 [Sphingomonas sp. BN140010]|uniref:Uncharacterized protein n=1 Tax=Sphingomonas arvum TaxID=2992113 RepID=A0ABT3JFC5_9SPHN|nr:hypothetical protein [Sphingomonas sp. BN140010]MCW3797778.1 hypothetical protein [Sphingomonas sp. BN140010]